MGGSVLAEDPRATGPEPVATLAVHGPAPVARDRRSPLRPRVRSIDELLDPRGARGLARGTTIVRDAEELRVKESDRIATTCA